MKAFSKGVKSEAHKRSGFRCERCWSSQNLVYHSKVSTHPREISTHENRIVLCTRCCEIAPRDPSLMKMFLDFASPKEMIKYYNVKTEEEAVEAWCIENEVSVSETLKKLNIRSRRSSVKSAMKKKVLKGEICGFNAPFGYEFSDGILRIVKDEAIIVEDVFSQYCNGSTLKEIADTLNSRGIRTKKNNKWSIWAVRRILKNPIYAGYVKWNGIINKGKHPSIITPKKFNEVQTRMTKKTIRKPFRKLYINDGGPSLSNKTERQMEKNTTSTQITQG